MTEVTAGGIRSGDPDVLAGLCKRRGGAVLVYCEYVAAPGQAGHAAAEAFARFRANVYASNELTFDAESLLLSATRQAAAARAPRPEADERVDCPEPALVVGWIEDTLSATQREHFEEHVATCAACVDAVTRFEAAERAYEHPPKAPLPLRVTRKIVDALVAAAPVTAMNGDAAAVHEAAEQGAAVNASPPREARVPAPVPVLAAPMPAAAQTPADRGNGSGAPSPRGAGRAALASAVAGSTMIDRVQELAERGRRAPRGRPALENARLRLQDGTGRRWAFGIALAGVVALIVSLTLFTPDDSPAPSGDAGSSLAGQPPAPEPAAGSPSALEDEPGAAAAKQPATSTRQARERQARRAAAERRAERAARSRRAAAARRRAAAAAARRRAAASPSRERTPARAPSPAPAAQRPAPRPTPPPAPAPARPQPDRTPSRPSPSDELPGGDFTVSGET